MAIADYLEVYFICGTQDVSEQDTLPKVLSKALDAGITCFQFREKGPGSLQDRDEVKAMAETCLALCRNAGVPFVMNDDVEMALEIGADGMHVGQDDRPIEETIDMVDGKMFVGLSVANVDEFKKAATIPGLDYVGAGPIYQTSTKVDAKEPVGLSLLENISSLHAPLPVVAIGGISVENAQAVHATGVEGLSVISAIAHSEEIYRTVEKLKKQR